MASGNFRVRTTAARGGLTIDGLYRNRGLPVPSTPGNVGVCLSGGGSRALAAGMGQLRALGYLTLGGESLLGQVKALSTVSGGSWLGVPFVFLPPAGPSDDAYLGPFVADQASLTPAQLAQLPAGNAGVPITSETFSLELLALEAFVLYDVLGVAPNMLWQTLIALHILAAHGLSSPVAKLAPSDTLSYDEATVRSEVTDPAADPPLNPSLAGEVIDLFADAPGRTHRPYLICNMGMFLDETGILPLAPVQSGGFITGILGAPEGTDRNGQRVGGGGVASFAFNSVYAGGGASAATVGQLRQWSLTDAVGTSSAAFADVLQNQFARWASNPLEFAATLAQWLDDILQWIRSHLPAEAQGRAAALVRERASAVREEELGVLKFSFPDLQMLIPRYQYWPVVDPQPIASPQPTNFADGGSLENTGVGGLLAYSDIDGVVAFVNTMVPLQQGQYGVADGKGGFIPGTGIIVDESIPPLFGYKPYETGGLGQYKGYVPYTDTTNDDYGAYAHNQVFDQGCLAPLLQGLAAASGEGFTESSAIFTQQLDVQANPWFGVTGGRSVTVVWCYLNYAAAWAAQFQDNAPVAALVEQAVREMAFPHYDTLDTALTATEVNLLSNLTAWAVAGNAPAIAALFRTAPNPEDVAHPRRE